MSKTNAQAAAKKSASGKFKFSFLKKQLPLLTMVVPGTILAFMFSYMPMFGIIMAFKRIKLRDGIWGSPWCGLDNFQYLFKTNELSIMLRNTIGYNLMFMVLATLLGVALAITLTLVRQKRASKLYQTVFVMPHFLSIVIIAYLVLSLLNMENGFVNKTILPLFGIEPINWYTTKGPWPAILTVVHFWQELGFTSIIFLSTIAGIDTQLYEAASIDGANLWQQIKHITLPMLRTIICIRLILGIGKILGGDFGLFYHVPMDSGVLSDVTLTIPVYVYKNISNGGADSLGVASAVSFVQSVVGFVLVLITNAAVNKIDSNSALF